jgi:hypothetical protein
MLSTKGGNLGKVKAEIATRLRQMKRNMKDERKPAELLKEKKE